MTNNTFARKALSVIVAVCMVLSILPVYVINSSAQSVSVSTLAQLQDALANEAYDEIIVTATINLPDGAEIYGNGKTVRAQVTGVDEQGIVQTGSNYNVFKTAANATVHIYDMVIMGGSVTAVVNQTGKLYLDNVTITRSGSATNPGGGIVNGVQNIRNNKNTSHKTAYVVMTNSSIVRNVAKWGGGFLNYGTLIMDGCSLSENRSINQSGGGGAGENEGYAYLNNCTVANNTSSEIGGGINICKAGELYVMNCTFTGNVTYNNTNGGSTFGGAVGVNDSCIFKAVNSIFANNYYINKSTETVTPCDIGMYNSSNIYMYDSIVGTVAGGTPHNENCSNETDGLFAAYVMGNVLAGDGTESTSDFSKPAVVQNASGELYTPLNGDYQGDIEGVPTYFDYSDLDNIRMYFTDEDGTDSTFFAGSGTQPTDIPVGDALDDTDRDTTLIGSSNSLGEGKAIYTIKVVASQHGKIKGGTIYGDSYIVVSDGSVVSVEEIVTVTLEATPDSGYYFDKWVVLEGAGDSSELAQLAAEIEALQAQVTKINNAVSEMADQADNVNDYIAYADRTSNFYTTYKRTLVTNTNTLVNTLNGYKTSFSSYSDVVSAITSANLSTKSTSSNNTIRSTKYSTWCNSVINTATSVTALLNAHLTEVQAQIAAKQAEYDAAVAEAMADTGLKTGNNPMEFVVDRNIELKAEFVAQAPDYTVTFHSNTEPETTVTQTFAAGHYTANLTANTFTNDGQPFLGWSMVYCGDVEYADGVSYTASGNADLYARWGYTVDYNANGGRNVPDSQIKNPGEALNISSVAPTRDGYTFKGWGLAADSTEAVLQPGGVYGVDKNIVLYAIWEQLKVPEVLNTTLADGYLNVPYSGAIETDQDAIIILADGSTLPAGLTIGKDGTITGTPTATGTFTFDVSVYNKDDTSLANATTTTITITITDPKTALQELVNTANAVDQDDYTPETAQNLQDAIDNGQSVLDDDGATLSEISDAIQELQDALNQLALDKSALAAAIAQGEAITDDAAEAAKYTADSLAVLENALNAGEIVYENTKATAEQIASATQAILDAINSLKRNVDKDDLQELVDQANAINQDDYTDTTADALQDAIDDAQAVLDDPNATDDEISNAYEALEDAINNLKPDKTELAEAIADGNDVVNGDTSAYTSSSVQALENAIDAGQDVYDDPNATVQEIKDATDAIRNALENLLEEAVNNAEDIINNNSDDYTDDSIQALEDAISDAEDVINNPNSTPDEIKDAIDAIEDAINNLKPDKTELAEAIAEGTEIVNGDTSGFTPSSVQALEDAIAQGEAVDADPNATVEEIKAATEAIKDALENLLEEAVDNAEDIVNNNSEDYTPESIQDVQDAIDNAKDVINNPDSTPDEIKNALDAIEDAVNNLKPDKTELEKAIADGNEIVNGDTDKFTPESVQALEDAIAQGEAVDADPDATVEEIKAATEAIKNALENLLEQAVDNAEDIINNNPDDYTEDSIQALEDAISDAQDVINNLDSTPEEIADAIQAIENAINNLIDRSKLADAIADGNDVLGGDTSAYTSESVDALEDAVAAGQTVYNDPDATQAEIDAATQAIRNALENLLEEAVDNAEDIINNNSDDYTPDSIQDVQDAIDNAKDVINNPDSTPDEIKNALDAIEDAINALELTKITPDATSEIIVDRETGTEYTYMVGLDLSANSVADIKAQLENDDTTIIILRNDVELDENELVGTGCIVKCVSKADPSIVYEVATVILYGDVNGDGLVDGTDKSMVFDDAFTGGSNIDAETVFYIAADLSKDGVLDAFDYFDQDGIITGERPFDQTLTLYK
ncbi:MAG: InlB B-repeat-containing protein [Clostridiaceae bacterium]|nr:InlB B-repeat-containing protein [Clostridiaceae bacterium]